MTGRAWCTAALVAGTVVLSGVMFAISWSGSPGLDALLWFAACVAGELLWLRLPLDRATVSMSSSFNFAALLLLTRSDAMIAVALSVLVAELAIVRKPVVRAMFNSAQASLAVGVGSMAFHALRSHSSPGLPMPSLSSVAALIVAAVCYYVINRGAVSLAIAVSQGVDPLGAWRANFSGRHELVTSAALFLIGSLLAMFYPWTGMIGVIAALIPLAVACDAYRRRLERSMARIQPSAQPEVAT